MTGMSDNKPSGLALMRAPFPDYQVSKLPKGTKAQNDCPPNEKRNCSICGGWHHPKIVHLDYVGHAALTDRLLDADPNWSWEPMAKDADGLPLFDKSGGLWIRLTVCGVTRLGYGHAASKAHMDIGAREKEVIGDALRNAGMRFGAALALWHKGELHPDEPEAVGNLIDDGLPVEDTSEFATGAGQEHLRRFETAQTMDEWKAVNDDIKSKWDTLKHIKGFSEDLVRIRTAAAERIRGQRQPGQEG